jgi:hypothetical protein
MAVVLLLAVLVLVAWLVTRSVRARAFRRAAVSTTAEITDIRWKTVGPLPERDRLAFPTLPEIGDRVPVLYLPENPGRARVENHASPSSGSTSGT